MSKKGAAKPHSERKHAAISPSGLKNFEICPGYEREQKDKEDEHAVTREGTTLHEAIETGDYSGLDEHQIGLCEFCTLYADMLPSCLGEIVDEPKLDIVDGVFGFADRLQLDKPEAHVDLLDWKLGWHEVEAAETNPQGWGYAVGVFEKYAWASSVTVHFVQPRIGFTTSHTFTRKDLPVMRTRVKSIVARVGSATPDDYNPTASNCMYCARVNCPKIGKLGEEIAAKYADGRNTRLKAEAALANEPDPELLEVPDPIAYPRLMDDPNEIAKGLKLAPILESWAHSMKSRATQMRVESGEEIPGYELTHRAVPRKIVNTVAAFEAVKDRVSAEDMVGVATISYSKLKDLYGQHSKKGKKAGDIRDLETRLEELDALSEGGDIPILKKTKKNKK